MISHIVFFRPKPKATSADRQRVFDALADAAAGIPSVRRFLVGTRVKHGPRYEQLMTEDYPYSAVIEFDDLAGLQAYLQHPKHETLGALFYQWMDEALTYDYEMAALSTKQ